MPEGLDEMQQRVRADVLRVGPPLYVPQGRHNDWYLRGYAYVGSENRPIGVTAVTRAGQQPVQIETAIEPKLWGEHWAVHNAIASSLPGPQQPISYPITVTVNEGSVTIPVDGSPGSFRMVSTASELRAWALIEGRHVTVSCTPEQLAGLELTALSDIESLPIERFGFN